MIPGWFKPRGYKHFDAPVGEAFAKQLSDSRFIEKHSWLPLIHYTKQLKRYRPKTGRTEFKERAIMYASHRDACIFSKYASELSTKLDFFYEVNGLERHVIAYRKLGKSNYHFSAEAHQFAVANAPCVVLCFDITGFFDHLDHRILKKRLKRLLGVSEIPNDWYAVFRHVTCFKKIERDDLSSHPKFGPRLKSKTHAPVATIEEVLAAGIGITINPNRFGIPQGTPISSALSNLYLIELDLALATECQRRGALYQRYSDDILIICNLKDEAEIQKLLTTEVTDHCLEIEVTKSDRRVFDPSAPETFQYLGFNISPAGAVIRSGSLSRQWRKAKRSIAKTRQIGKAAIAAGRAKKIYTKKLWRRFSPVGARNFSSYARRSADAFGSKKIVRQVRRIEGVMDQAIREIDK